MRRRLSVMTAAAILLAVPALATWYVHGVSTLYGSYGAPTLDFDGLTSVGQSGGTNVGTVNPTDKLRVESWVDGAYVACDPPSTITNGACVTSSEIQAGYPFASGGTYGTGPIQAGVTWCAHSRHVFIRDSSNHESIQGPDSYSCASYEGTDQICEELYGSGYVWNGNQCTYSPIIVPVGNRNDFQLTSAASGVMFDIDGDGQLEQVAWPTPDSELAFLAIDRNGNGRIDSGKELFGPATVPGARNGYEALAKIAPITGIPGYIDADDEVYPKLLLWEDRDHNGYSEADELRPASDLLVQIGLGAGLVPRRDGNGNLLRLKGWAVYRTAPGKNAPKHHAEALARQRAIYDVYLAVQ